MEGGVGIELRETQLACEEETEGGMEIELRGTRPRVKRRQKGEEKLEK